MDKDSHERNVRGKGDRERTVKINHEAAGQLNRYLRAKPHTPLERIPQLVVQRGEECSRARTPR